MLMASVIVGIGSPYYNVTTGLNPWTTVTTGGYIGIKNFDMTVRIKARTTDTYGAATGADPNAIYGVYSPTSYPGLRPLTIDVATTCCLAQDPNLYGDWRDLCPHRSWCHGDRRVSMSFDIGLGTHTGVTASAPPAT